MGLKQENLINIQELASILAAPRQPRTKMRKKAFSETSNFSTFAAASITVAIEGSLRSDGRRWCRRLEFWRQFSVMLMHECIQNFCITDYGFDVYSSLYRRKSSKQIRSNLWDGKSSSTIELFLILYSVIVHHNVASEFETWQNSNAIWNIVEDVHIYMLSHCVAKDDKDERESNDGKSRIPSMLMLLFLSLILTERRKQRKNNHRHTWKFRNNNICNIFTSLRALRRVIEWVFYDFCWLFYALGAWRDLNLK